MAYTRYSIYAVARKNVLTLTKKKPYGGKLALRPDHPRRRTDEIRFGTVGGFRALVVTVSFKFHENQLSGY